MYFAILLLNWTDMVRVMPFKADMVIACIKQGSDWNSPNTYSSNRNCANLHAFRHTIHYCMHAENKRAAWRAYQEQSFQSVLMGWARAASAHWYSSQTQKTLADRSREAQKEFVYDDGSAGAHTRPSPQGRKTTAGCDVPPTLGPRSSTTP